MYKRERITCTITKQSEPYNILERVTIHEVCSYCKLGYLRKKYSKITYGRKLQT